MMEGERLKYFSGRAIFVPKFVWGAVAFAIIAITVVHVIKVYSANSSSASLNVGGTYGFNAEIKVADTVNNVVSSIASATSTVNTVGNELFPEIKNMMIIYNVDSGYVEKLEKGRRDMQGITRLLEGVQESLRIMNLGSVTEK